MSDAIYKEYPERRRSRRAPTELHAYLTHHEVAFLAGLGTYSECRTPRLELLRRYLRSMGLRQEWGRVRRLYVLEAVLEMIKAEEAVANE